MRLPLIGFVGKSPYSIGGISNSNGFGLEIYNKHKNSQLIFSTENYWDDNNESAIKKYAGLDMILLFLTVLITSIISVSLTLVDLVALNSKEPIGYLELFLRIVLQPMIFYTIIFSTLRWLEEIFLLFTKKDWKEWHACEHKSIVLLRAGLEPTVENLKSCPTALMNCGVAIDGTFLMALNALLGFLAINRLFSPEIEMILIAIELVIFASYLFFRVTVSMQIEKSTLILPILALPAAALPLLLQRLLALKKPSDQKLAQTAAELKRLIEFHSSFFKNSA